MQSTITINNNKNFLFLYRRGTAVISKQAVVYFKKNNKKINKLGITAGKKVGNAVCRNRAKRIIRAAYRAAEEFLPKGIDMVIVARSAIADAKSTDIEKFLKKQVAFQMKKAFSAEEEGK